MRRTPAVRVAATIALLLAAAGVVQLLQRVPPPEDVVAGLAGVPLRAPANLSAGSPPTPDQARTLRKVIDRLGTAPRRRAAEINWAEARQWRAVTADGVRLTLQAVPAGSEVLVRLTADPMPGVSADAVARASAVRALRGRAYVLPARDAGLLVAR